MPPKPKFAKEEMVKTALNVVSKEGIDALTAKRLATALGSSARPIFTFYKTMQELKDDVREAAMKHFEKYMQNFDENVPIFKQVGEKMVLFGTEEPKLYQFLFMKESKTASNTFDDIFDKLGESANLCINAIKNDYELNDNDAKFFFENLWIYTYGIATLCATKMCVFPENQISEMLSTQFQAVMVLLKSKK